VTLGKYEVLYVRTARFIKLPSFCRKSQLLSFLLCIGSIDVALGHEETEQRLLDVLHDFYEDKIFTFDDIFK
jgi:hypothetical protein